MIKALIIDDVERARQSLRDDIEDYCENVLIVGEADGVSSGIDAIRSLKPALVFLDIQMDDGTGFDLLEQIGAVNFKIIFTTALDEYAIRAFRFSAVDYLLKPIDPDQLQAAVAKIHEEPRKETSPYDLLLENLKKIQNSSVRKIALNTQEKVHIVAIDEVIRCESNSNYTLFHLTQKRNILVTKTLKEFEELFHDYNFIRVHHSHLINLDFMSEFVKTDGGYALMADGTEVPVSTRKRDALMKKLQEL